MTTVGQGVRLREAEAAYLEALWSPATWGEMLVGGAVRSNMGAIRECLLRKSLPREGQARHAILAELARAGGRLPEGKLLRIVVVEGTCSRREASAALQLLRDMGKIERVRVDAPPSPKRGLDPERARGIDNIPIEVNDDGGLTQAEQEWTGFDVRYIPADERAAKRKAMRDRKVRKGKRSRDRVDAAAVLLEHVGADGDVDPELVDVAETAAVEEAVSERPSGECAQERRWRTQDEALQRSCRMMDVQDDSGGGTFDEGSVLAPGRLCTIERAMAALALMPREMIPVLRWEYGGGEGERPTEEEIDEACREFRAALKASRKAERS